MRSFKNIVLFCFLLLCYHTDAQDIIVGLKYGFGTSSYKRIENSEHTASTGFNQYGISLAYSPYYSKFSVESSIEYEKNDLADYLYIPLGFRITIGKRLRPFFECGGYYSFILNGYTDEYSMNNDYGARIGAGLLFAINKRWRVETGYYRLIGFAGTLVENIPVPVNSYITEKNKMSANNFEFAFKYRF